MRMDGAKTAANRDGSRAWITLAVRWVAALLILAVLVYFLHLPRLRAALSGIPASRFALLLMIYLLTLVVGAAKWHVVVNSAGAGLRWSVSAQCYTGGIFGALFLPSVVGGDIVRLTVGISRSNRPAAVITGNFVDRLLDASAQLFLALLGLSLLPGSMPHAFAVSAGRLWFVGVVLAVVVSFVGVFVLWLIRKRNVRVRRWLAQLRRAKRAMAARPFRIVLGWLLGVCVQSSFLMITMLLGVSCGLHLRFRVWLFAWPLSKIAALLPITQGGIGVRETALVALLRPFGAPASQVLATGIASEGVIITAGLLSGLAAFLLRRKDASDRARADMKAVSGA